MTTPAATRFERALAAVAPGLALRRQQSRTQAQALAGLQAELQRMVGEGSASGGTSASASGYTSTAGTDPFMGRWMTMPRDAAADTLRQLGTMRAQCRDLVRNNPIAASAINTNVVRAIGTGLAYSAQPHLPTLGWSPERGRTWAAHAQAEFSLFADSTSCDWEGQQNFYDKQDLTLRAMLESGDALTLLPDGKPTAEQPYKLRLQTLEADRCGNPQNMADSASVAGGVRRAAGQGRAFHIYDQHPGSSTAGANRFAGRWIEAVGPSGRRRLLHHYKLLRPESPRGVPYLAPVVGLFKLMGTYTDAEVKAAVISAYLTLIIKTPTGTSTAPVFGLNANQPPTSQKNGQAQQDLALGPAAVLGLADGEDASVVNPMRPNPEFGAFVQSVLDQLGAGLFIGSEMLMKKYNTSYVAARAAYLDAWKHLLDMRTVIARTLCQPVLETWMAEAVAIGRIEAPGFFADVRMRWAYTRAAWRGDSPGSINPKDEVSAWIMARDGRLATSEQASWELYGTDWNDSYPVMLTEHQRMAQDGTLPTPKAGAAAPLQPQPAATMAAQT